MLANCRSQLFLNRLGRCLKLFISTDSTSCHEFASQFGLAFSLYAKNTHKLSRRPTLAHTWLLNESAAPVTMPSWLNRQRPIGAATTAWSLGLERIHQVTNTIRIAIQGGEYDTYREYTFSQRLNYVMGKIWRRLTDCLESVPMSCLSLSFNYRK